MPRPLRPDTQLTPKQFARLIQRPELSTEEFGHVVRYLRRTRGLSLRDVARRLRLSTGFYAHGEVGERDLRKPEYVDQLALILGADIGQLRRAAGLESADLGGLRFFRETAGLANDLLSRPATTVAERRLRNAIAWLLQWLWFAVQEALGDGTLNETAIEKTEEMLRVLVAVVERKFWGPTSFSIIDVAPKDGQQGLYATADAALDQLYRLHGDEIERLLRYELST